MRFDLIRPCAHCPFNARQRGFLHPARAAEIVDALLGDDTFACHETTEDDPADTGDRIVTARSQHCAGAAIFLEKQGAEGRPNQWMRIAERLGIYDRTRLDRAAPVFSTRPAFIAHHRAAWRADRQKLLTSDIDYGIITENTHPGAERRETTMAQVNRDAFWLDQEWLASPMAKDPRFWPKTTELAEYYGVSVGAVRVKAQPDANGQQTLPAVQLGPAQASGTVSVWRFNPVGLPASPQAWKKRFHGGKRPPEHQGPAPPKRERGRPKKQPPNAAAA